MFPLEGNFDIDAGDGGGQFRTTTPHKSKKIVRTEIVHTIGTFFQTMSKPIFKICSYIQEKTQDQINAFKISFYNTKNTNNARVHFKKS